MEYDPNEIWRSVVECIECGTKNLFYLDINPNDIVGVGITNERGSTVIWNKFTGQPLYNAIGEFLSSSIVFLIFNLDLNICWSLNYRLE